MPPIIIGRILGNCGVLLMSEAGNFRGFFWFCQDTETQGILIKLNKILLS